MNTCDVCGAFMATEAYTLRDGVRYVCPKCLETAKHSLLSVCPKCGYTSWLNTDATIKSIALAHLLCPDCREEFHTIDGFKRRG